MKQTKKRIPMKKLAIILCICLTAGFTTAKSLVKGLVTDKEEHGILNVTITLDRGKTGTATDAQGHFSLEIYPGEHELHFSHIQYKTHTKKISIADNQELNILISMDEAVFSLDQISVSGSATEMELKKLPSSISVITVGDPEFMGITTVDDILSRVPGIFVDRSRGLTTTGSHTSVSLRGTAAANRTLVMKDGIPLNNAYTGSITEWNTMASNSVSRIEVVRGAGSSLYGTNAMGGVINMITENPRKNPVLEVAKYSSMTNAVFNLKAGKAFDSGLGFMLFSEYKQTDGYQYMDQSLWKNYYEKPTNKMFNLTGKAIYQFKNASLLEFVGDFHQEKPVTGTSTQYGMDNKTGNFLLRYKNSGKLRWNLTAYTNHSKNKTDALKWNTTSSAFDNNYYSSDVPYHENGFLGKINSVFGSHTVTLGTDIRLYKMKSEYDYSASGISRYEGEQLFISALLNDEIALGKKINASLGVRYDYWSNRDGSFSDNTSGEQIDISYPEKTSNIISPKAGLVYRISDKYRLRTSFSTGFKAPSMYYLYRSAPHGTTTFDLGNPDLDPERMTYSYEAGGDFYLNDKLEFSATYYISQFKDFLDKINVSSDEVPDYFNPGEGVVVRQSVNIGKVRLQGVETFLKYKIQDCLTASASYSFTKSKILRYESDETLEDNELEDNPKHLFNVGFLFNKPKLFSAGVWYKYVGGRYPDMENTQEDKIDGYGLVTLDISRSFLEEKLRLSVSVSNLFDKQYYGYYGSATSYYYGEPRIVMGGFSFKF